MAKKDGELTPMMKQFFDLKAKHPDAVLLFRCGDFYETYCEDAVIASRILGITLTKRNNGYNKGDEMAGNPVAPSPYSLEERLQRALQHIDKNDFITLQEYANLNKLNYSTASRELAKLVADPQSGIKAKGAGSHKVWVHS